MCIIILDKVPGFEYKDGHFCEFKNSLIVLEQRIDNLSTLGRNDKLVELIDNHTIIVPNSYRDIIDSSINKLFTNLGMDVFKDRNKLVSLTHMLPLWKWAFLWDPTKKMSIKPTDLAKDYKKYYELCSKLANKDI